MLDVWLIDVRRESVSCDVLSGAERIRAAQFRFDDDRRRYVVAHARLREIVADAIGDDAARLRFESGTNGKPFLHGRTLELSLSHSGDLVAIALSNREVGIDVERIVPRGTLPVEQSLNAAERAWLRAQPDPQRAFFRLWTMKEAAMKADGTGLSLPLDEVVVDVDALDRVFVRGTPWFVQELTLDGYAGAVAI